MNYRESWAILTLVDISICLLMFYVFKLLLFTTRHLCLQLSWIHEFMKYQGTWKSGDAFMNSWHFFQHHVYLSGLIFLLQFLILAPCKFCHLFASLTNIPIRILTMEFLGNSRKLQENFNQYSDQKIWWPWNSLEVIPKRMKF